MIVLNSGLPLSPSALYKLLRFRPALFAISAIPRAGDEPKGVAHEIRVAGFERRRDISDLTLFGVEIVDGVKSGGLGHHKVNASVWARLMSCRCCVCRRPRRDRSASKPALAVMQLTSHARPNTVTVDWVPAGELRG
jgi:hypothetical protein